MYFSAISIAEITIKSMLGKLSVPEDIEQQLVASGLNEMPVTSAHAGALRALPVLVRHDPFDRLLVAQSASPGSTC